MWHTSIKITMSNGDIAELDLKESEGDDFDFNENDTFFVVTKNGKTIGLYNTNYIVSIVLSR